MRDLTFPAGVKPSITIKIKQADGTVYTLTDKNIQAGSVSFAFGTSNGGEFTIGGAVIGSFKFNIINRMQIWDSINYINATVEPTLTFGEKTLNMGKYWFVNHKETGSVIVCETYDALQILDEHQIHEDDIVYPTTVQDLAQKIASKRGFTVTGLLNGSIPINDPKNDDMTERECFSYLAKMTGQFVVAKGDTLVFGKYDKKTFHDAGVTFSHDLRTEPISITGVKVYTSDSGLPAIGGKNGYMVEIQDNPFITKENVINVVSALNKNIVGISFYPGTFYIRANPAIEAGDGLTLTTDKRTVKVYATTITYKLQLQESITADADDYAGDMRLSKRQKISQIAKKAAQITISEDLKNPDSELSQAIGGGSGGGVKNRKRYDFFITTIVSYNFPPKLYAYVNTDTGMVRKEVYLSRLQFLRINFSVTSPQSNEQTYMHPLIGNVMFSVSDKETGDTYDLYGLCELNLKFTGEVDEFNWNYEARMRILSGVGESMGSKPQVIICPAVSPSVEAFVTGQAQISDKYYVG